MKFEFDPKTGQYGPVPKKPEDDIHLMSQMPARSCWIKLLHNRISLKSVGNLRYAKVMWYNAATHTVAESRCDTDTTLFRSYILPKVGKPAGWIYVNK